MAVVISQRKWFILLATATTTTILLMLINKPNFQAIDYHEQRSTLFLEKITLKNEKPGKNWRGLTETEISKLSVLGRILYLEEEPPQIADPKRNYQIFVWKYGKTIENRHLKQYGNQFVNPFSDCPVQNCHITYNETALKTADIVIFHMHRMKPGDLPKRTSHESQIWAFLTDESPHHTFLSANNLTNYNGVFNWSMTYRMDADIPVPYGRTILRKTPIEQDSILKRRDVLVAIMGSNCGGTNKRWEYVKELQKHIVVDTYGGCGSIKTCPGHFKKDCPQLGEYLFYLSFENSNCDEYVTEKLWWNAFEKNSIPIVMGAPVASYRKLLPPHSFLHVEDYARPKDLAQHILYLNKTGKFRNYHKWKGDFEVLNEHAYFQSKSYHYCRVCEALNYNQKHKKVYQDLSQFWGITRDCYPAWNAR
ncbi:alpha-(1,3)-fucosyltransferase 7-like [Tribolium madens]|uniref:alpha-(1,3)-fucosyltransferase 7-like n=1 Tax=Tribolium madens TaxID=41895 RepID=UPI001CF736A2|nr:alpha-(1,3)-fucosyltransferase 7-like [Tribolium madens]XP_044272626.1 alpha-(1,3)-fucosyltransferase 7-like [Tribolium madens]XP_044272627.1 alpha-(1,3)-fucosyltransferase 7-like [Tribolium madens]XP_044272628.1 alpha-(1,3)-fucosyltransferase 7-like [Tribolium madens]